MRVQFAFLAGLMALATPVWAQDPTVDTKDIESCLAANTDQHACIGRASATCIEDAGGGGAVYGACYGLELDFWDGLLNRTYSDLITQVQAFDDAADETGSTPAIAEDELRSMQRAWISYRDSRCTLIGLSYNGGTGAGPGGTECKMQATAEQAFVLRDMVDRFQKP